MNNHDNCIDKAFELINELHEHIVENNAVVKRGIKAKFFQNKDIMRNLICTRDALIAECAPNDNKWGIGIAVDDPNRFDVDKWTGQNLLGRILMEVREELRQLSEFSTNMLNRKEYFDAANLSPIPEWEMTIGELVRIPKYRNTVNAYREVCKWSAGHDVTDLSLIKIESMHRTNMGGGLPLAGFWELKQDLYEINSKMFIMASGFDAPACGKVMSGSEKLVPVGDGTFKIVKDGEDD